MSQLQPSPLLVRANHVAYRMADELVFLDMATLARLDGVSVRYRSMCVLSSGELAAFETRDGGGCQVDIFDGTRLARSLVVPECVSTIDGARLATGARDEVYVLRGQETLLRYRIKEGALFEAGWLALQDRAVSGTDQLVGLGDGRIILPAGKGLQIYGAGNPRTLAATGRPAHLAIGAKGKLWYSVRSPDRRLEQVVLLDDAGTVVSTVSTAPGHITHMAASPTGALALLLSQGENWVILVLDEHGAERRRVTLERDVVETVGPGLARAFVALTEQRIIVAAGTHGLFAWDLATGARVRS